MAAIPGVTGVKLNFGTSKLTVEGVFDPKSVTQEGKRHDIIAQPDGQAGEDKKNFLHQYRSVLISGLSGLAVAAGYILKLSGAPEKAVAGAFIAAIIIGGFSTARKAFYGLRRLDLDMNVLMTVAVIGAAAIGEWSEGGAVAFLFSVSNALEAYTMEKARRSIRELMDIAPREALVRRSCGVAMVPVEEIQVGDILIIKPGDKVAMDGRVVRGNTTINQAPITGESIPVDKTTGDEVFAGTLNNEGYIEAEVTKLAGDTTIAKIIHMVEEAQARKAPSQKFIDRFAAVYTPIVIALAAGLVLIPPLVLGLPWNPWIYRGLTMLVVSCPCALVVSTPVALVTSIGNAARNGVLIKGGVHLEQAGSLEAIAFDKTGTLTVGRPAVTDIIPLGESDPKKILALGAGVEQLSEHPLAKAIVAKASEQQLSRPAAEEFTSLTGKGASALIDNCRYYIGSPGLFNEMGLLTGEPQITVTELQAQGKTAMVLGTEDQVLGIIAVADKVKQNARDAIGQLKKTGIRQAIMLTGDNEATAAAIAAETGMDSYLAELLPENKVAAVKELLHKYGRVAMVGDGINDTPALATATVGIAMGAAGTDTALETADIALMADDLAKIPFVINLSKRTLGIIKQNITFSLVIKIVALLAIFPGWLTLWLAILADMGASVLVTLNGIRLLGVKP